MPEEVRVPISDARDHSSYGAIAGSSRAPQKVRIRCGMLCCAKEKELITRAFQGPAEAPGLPGLQSYRVNVLGRMVEAVYEDPADPMDLVRRLNELFLGASIHETGDDDKSTPAEKCAEAVLTSPAFVVFVVQSLLWLVSFLFSARGMPSAAVWALLGITACGALALGSRILQRMAVAASHFDPNDKNGCAVSFAQALVAMFSPDMTSLMLIASVGALLIGQYTDAALLLWLFSAAQLLQSSVVAYAAAQVDSCGAQLPTQAYTYPSGEKIGLDSVRPGVTLLQVRAGEAVPVDGVVVEPTTEAFVDEKAVTGEARPILKHPGEGPESAVRAGALLVSGFMVVKATKSAESSFAATVQACVEEAASQRTQTQDVVDGFATVYTTVVLCAAGAFLAGALVDSTHSEQWVRSALLLIVLGCPCALVTASPIVHTCGIAAAANAGCLVKEANALDALGKVTRVTFDKTGTLTDGCFQVADLWVAEGMKDALRAVSALEATSNHPLAVAIVEHQVGCITEAVNREKMGGLKSLVTGKVETKEGQGVQANMQGFGNMRVGRAEYCMLPGGDPRLSASAVTTSGAPSRLWDTMGECTNPPDGVSKQQTLRRFVERRAAKSLVYAAVERPREGYFPVACFALHDRCREPGAFDAVEWLQGTSSGKLGVEVYLLSGDRAQVVEDVGELLGIRNRHAQLLPEDKMHAVQLLRTGGQLQSGSGLRLGHSGRAVHGVQTDVVLMVGDGINDGPALAAADVGWAMGAGGTALASQSAHVVQTHDDISVVPAAVQHGRNCRRIVVQNIVIAVAPKLTLGLLTVTGIWQAPLWSAVAADTGCLTLVLLNGMRALRWPSPPQLWA
eukprot:TRINITY_DN18399_c0_g1_i1.p1 TRINITY_DN18399_c0_g1~~TRINITY_DN18399_c0_g1_i1.p1  ORF type:complete len:884 (+),score=315.86 TRINITY_DN18399_c0_g1_i1:105-2654(+)